MYLVIYKITTEWIMPIDKRMNFKINYAHKEPTVSMIYFRRGKMC